MEKLEKMVPLNDFLNEKLNSKSINENIFQFSFKDNEFILSVNESFVKDLQLHIKQTIDILMNNYGYKLNKVDKVIETNLHELTVSFQAGDSAEDTAAKIA